MRKAVQIFILLFLLFCKIFITGLKILLLKLRYRLFTYLFMRKKHIKSMKAIRVYIDLRFYTCLFQIVDICKSFAIERLNITDKCISWWKI